ncbi:MAG: glycosyltransferase [bacterium]|nr:glycosyltransferase [bacterium]
MKKHRLLHVLYTGDLAGAEVCVKMLVANMDKSSFDNSVCFLYELGVVGEQIQCLGIPVFNFGMKHGFHFAGALRFLKFIVTKKFDLIHFHAPNVLTILMGRMVCNKVIYHVHNSGKSDGLRRFFLKMLFSFFDKIIAVSCDSKNNFQQTYSIPDSKISIVYNAIDTKRFDLEFDHRAFKQSYGIPLTKPLIGFVGRSLSKGM